MKRKRLKMENKKVDKIVLIPSATLGLILIALYCWRCWKSKKKFKHSVMINTIFQSSGIVCGVFLVISIYIPDIKRLIADLDLYILISGLAVLAVSLQGFYRDAIKSTHIHRHSVGSAQDN